MNAYRPFPTDALPGPLVRLVREGAAALGCDDAFIALPALAVCAAAIGNTRVVRLKPSWPEPSIVWAAGVGDSGTVKTPAFKLAMAPVYAIQRRLIEEHKAHAGDEDRPKLRRVCCSDVTIEKLAEVLEDNPRGVLVARDELAGWVAGFKKYKGAGGSDLHNWLEMSHAGVIQYDRKTGDRRLVVVDRAAVSVTGSIQAGTLGRVMGDEHFESGLVARLLLAYPPRRAKQWNEAEIDPDVKDGYEQLVSRLFEIPMHPYARGELGPATRRLSPGAKEHWKRFYNAWGEAQAAASGPVGAALAKLEGYAARLALVHHVVTYAGLEVDDPSEIGVAPVEAGITLARWFAHEASRIYHVLRESEVERQTRELLEWAGRQEKGRATARALQATSTRLYPMAEDAEARLQELVDAGLGAWQEVPPGPRGGRPTRAFVPVEDVHTTNTTP